MSDEVLFPCPCCGYLVFSEAPDSYDNCPICFWEDDLSQLRFPLLGRGANRPSLHAAQLAYQKMSVIEARLLDDVRPAGALDRHDPDWRSLDPGRDVVKVPHKVVDQGRTYPEDSTALYYWRRSAG